MSSISIQPIGAFRRSVNLPGSKSLTNRALLLAALADGPSHLSRLLLADDSRVMLGALRELGVNLTVNEADRTVVIQGTGGRFPSRRASLMLGNAGTAYRFLTAALSAGDGEYELDGVPRMRERPIGQLVDPLRQLGAEIAYLGRDGYPPLRIAAREIQGGSLTLQPTLSSQYISALVQIAPYFKTGLTLRFDGPVTSQPYVAMTLGLMEHFGVEAEVDDAFTAVTVGPGTYRGVDYAIEPDASAASYFLAAAAIIPGSSCTIEGLGRRSLQGDVGFADVLHQMGAGLLFGSDFITIVSPADSTLRGIDVDLNHMPDMAQTLAVVALFAQGPTTIRNVGNLRVKETDRLAALETELAKLGAKVEVEGDDLHIEPPAGGKLTPAAIATYDDHRMAMSFAIAGLRAPGVVVNDPGCVSKTFPDYFDHLAKLKD